MSSRRRRRGLRRRDGRVGHREPNGERVSEEVIGGGKGWSGVLGGRLRREGRAERKRRWLIFDDFRDGWESVTDLP